ncbi:MAG: hypothetical protein PHP43_04870 [Methanoculleus sp.]|nr:hypothetical protein [Methanoculleus sp.]
MNQRHIAETIISPLLATFYLGAFNSVQICVDSIHAWGESVSIQASKVVLWFDETLVWMKALTDVVELLGDTISLVKNILIIIKIVIGIVEFLKKISLADLALYIMTEYA